MSGGPLHYDQMVEDALRGVVRRALRDVAKTGALPGNHHFYLTFKTGAAGVTMPRWLAEKYADEITIVLQHQFWNLQVDDDRFEVILSFNDMQERLVVPFAALTSFADPSVKFGLRFNPEPAAVPDAEGAPAPGEEEDPAPEGDEAAPRVVSLDQFRKRR